MQRSQTLFSTALAMILTVACQPSGPMKAVTIPSSFGVHDAASEPVANPSESLFDPDAKLKARSDILFMNGFDEGDGRAWQESFGLPVQNHPFASLFESANSFFGRSLSLRYLAQQYGPANGGIETRALFKTLGIALQEQAYLRYNIRFEPGFQWVKGGKLPGLAGQKTISGCQARTGQNGWSARYMWEPSGELIVYAYLAPLAGYGQAPCGEGFWAQIDGKRFRFETGKWYSLEQYVKLNTPGKADGVIRVWVNGVQALDLTNLPFRTVDVPDMKIGILFMSSFYGGNDASYAPSSDQYVQLDNFVIAENYIGPAVQ